MCQTPSRASDATPATTSARVDESHNNGLRLSNDATMRGRITDPAGNSAHRSEASSLFSGAEADSARMCGSCHDLVLPAPPAPAAVALERTFQEWSGAVFAPGQAPAASAVATCNSCHMPPSTAMEPVAEGPGLNVRSRTRHLHHFAAVDVALDGFPNTGDAARDMALRDQQRVELQQLLDVTLRIDICVQPIGDGSAVYITLDNANAGHNWPTGASQDRRAFVEVIAYAAGARIYESGVVADGQRVTELADPDLWLFRDRTFDADDKETHMFWKVARVESGTIGAQVTSNPADPRFYTASHAVRRFPTGTATTIPGYPDRVTVRVRIQTMGLDFIDDLIASGHLDAGLATGDSDVRSIAESRARRSEPAAVRTSRRGDDGMERGDADVRRVLRAPGLHRASPKDCVGMPRRP